MKHKPIHFITAALSLATSVLHADPGQEMYDRAMTVFKVDPGASLPLFQRAAKEGHLDAMIRLGHSYQTGAGVSQNGKQALAWYKRAADAGSVAAMNEIGAVYEFGMKGAPPEPASATEWYEKGVSHQSLKSCAGLARIYASSSRTALHDGAQAVKYASVLAKREPENAAYMDLLAAAHARDLNFPQALRAASEAITLSPLAEAAGRRDRRAAYERGEPWPAIASDEWLLRAAEMENPWATLKLAKAYDDFLSEDYDPVGARHWYEVSAENGSAEAMLRLGQMCEEGVGGEVNHEKAMWCYQSALDKGETEAYLPLAAMYVGGKGTRVNYERAAEIYQTAKDQGVKSAAHKLVDLRTVVRLGDLSSAELYQEAIRKKEEMLHPPAGEEIHMGRLISVISPILWAAAEQGDLDAMNELGDLYFYGPLYLFPDGPPPHATKGGANRNTTRAFEWYERLERAGRVAPELEECRALWLKKLREDRARNEKVAAIRERSSRE